MRTVLRTELNCYSIVIGGVFRIIFIQELDGQRGNKWKDSAKIVVDTCVENDLVVDIWGIRNPTAKPFTCHQKTPILLLYKDV